MVVLGLLFAAIATPSFSQEAPGLFVVPGAIDVQRDSGKGTRGIVYFVREPFPATEALAFIRGALAQQGWRSKADREGEWIDTTSDPVWRDSSDGQGTIRMWSAEWRDSRGNEVNYLLVYKWPGGLSGTDPSYVGVGATYLSKKAAGRVRALLEKDQTRVHRLLVPRTTDRDALCR